MSPWKDHQDAFQEFSDDLIVTIFSKIQDDPKTLIRCSSVSNYWASLASKLTTSSLRFFVPLEGDDDADEEHSPCFQSHHHTPTLAIPALMRVFENLESLEIKICFSQPCEHHSFRLKTTLAVSVPLEDKLLPDDDTPTVLEAEFSQGSTHIGSFLDFYTLMFKNRPKTLKTLVMMGTKIEGLGSGGMVFMTKEQILKYYGLSSKPRVNESWLENPENVVCWLNNPLQDEHWFTEKVWVVYQRELKTKYSDELNSVYKLIPEEIDVKNLLGGLDDDA
ncbi:unnamed protein product [Dovyalis caffra]|uniref:F-box domain-containing protein n=1 Tax=Dovyalis caffra TaxID=77055 RepID=A0AAV1RRS0_9ROSI|nr:unnamed protein product [Dovyalis caffra]